MTPRSQERLYPREYGATLIAIAVQDLDTGHFMERASGPGGDVRSENVLFFFHQASEKALKAVLCHLGIRVPLIHDLAALLAKLPDDAQPDVGYELADLNDYAGVLRYEEGRVALTSADIADAAAMARTVVSWAQTVVQGGP